MCRGDGEGSFSLQVYQGILRLNILKQAIGTPTNTYIESNLPQI